MLRGRFLTSAFRQDSAWAHALRSPLVAGVSPAELYTLIEKRAQSVSTPPPKWKAPMPLPPSTIDVDLFAMAVARDRSHLLELRDLLHRHRASGLAGELADSTRYATVRGYLEAGERETLLDVVDDRLNYGVFLDEFSCALLLDELVSGDELALAVRAAAQPMLQERFDGPVVERLAQLAALRFAKAYEPVAPEPVAPPPKKKPEVKKVRVWYLRNSFFDDHFDLREIPQLAGKTLCAASPLATDAVDASCRVVGLTLYGKFSNAKRVAEHAPELCEQSLRLLSELATKYRERERPNEAAGVEEVLKATATARKRDTDVELTVETRLHEAIAENEADAAVRHARLFEEWETLRKSRLKAHIERAENLKRAAAIREREQKLENMNQMLFWFDNKELIEYKFHQRKEWWKKQRKPRGKKGKNIEPENYVPPQV